MLVVVAKRNDFFTDRVIIQLLKLGMIHILRISEEDSLFVENINLPEQKIILSINHSKIDFDKVSLFWYRGGMLPMPSHNWLTENKSISRQVKRFISYEWKVLRDFLFCALQQKKHIGNYFLAETNKLQNLCLAQQCGLSVPDTYIAQNKFNEKLRLDINAYVVKPIGECMPFIVDKNAYRLFTKEVSKDYFENDNQLYFPSLLQNKIDVDFEIRVFVFHEFQEFYAMAIFQSPSEDNCDYRKMTYYNRYIPYSLPEDVKEKLLLFMGMTQLDTASFDLIKTRKGEFVFLEINPFGSMEIINETYGYEIEKRFAEIIYYKYCSII